MEADPFAVGRDGELADAVARIVRKPALLARIEVVDPEAGDGCRGISRLHGELLVGARAIVAVDAVRRHEVDALAVGRPLPVADARRVTRELRGLRDVHRRHRDGVDLLVARSPRREDDRHTVLAERKVGHAFARVGDAQRLAAVDAHDEDLIARAASLAAGSATARAAAATGRSGRRGSRRVAIRKERDEASVARPLWTRLVLVLCERELPSGPKPAVERHEIDVGLTASRLPVGGAQRVEHRLAVGTDVLPGDLPHVLRVEEGHRALRGCRRGDDRAECEDEELGAGVFHGGSSEKSGF